MTLDRLLADPEPDRDLRIRATLHDLDGDLPLSRSQGCQRGHVEFAGVVIPGDDADPVGDPEGIEHGGDVAFDCPFGEHEHACDLVVAQAAGGQPTHDPLGWGELLPDGRPGCRRLSVCPVQGAHGPIAQLHRGEGFQEFEHRIHLTRAPGDDGGPGSDEGAAGLESRRRGGA